MYVIIKWVIFLKIIKFKKIGKDKYKLFLDNNEELELYEDVIIKNELLLKKDIDSSNLDEINRQNKIQFGYVLAIKYISIKMRSEKEINEYLKKKNIDKNTIDIIIYKLKERNIINDKIFCKAFINDQISITNNGINKIKRELEKYGINKDIINEEINKIDSNIFREKLSKLINKKIKIKKGSSNLIKQKLLLYFINLGYDKDMVVKELSSVNIKTDLNILKKEYDKLYIRYSKKYSSSELNYILYNKLLSKGYKSDDINNVIKNKF